MGLRHAFTCARRAPRFSVMISVLVRARILQELQTTLEDGRVSVLSADSPQRLAVLRVTYADWNTLGQHFVNLFEPFGLGLGFEMRW